MLAGWIRTEIDSGLLKYIKIYLPHVSHEQLINIGNYFHLNIQSIFTVIIYINIYVEYNKYYTYINATEDIIYVLSHIANYYSGL